MSASIIIPTFNGAKRIGHCLESLCEQTAGRQVEILVVNDGSNDNITDVVERFAGVRLISQANAGPAAARNHGAREAAGDVILFTDDDCEPARGWLDAMLEPFMDPEVVGVKGAYRTRQKPLMARFVQAEYEDRYRLMAHISNIDFIDTYSAAFRRERFVEMGGYDTEFPVACAEDVELSFRMSARGWQMRFAPGAIVYHQHPDSLVGYLRKKFKFAFWRVLAVRKNPSKAVKDSHTPQLMKLQLLFGPAAVAGLGFDLYLRPVIPITAVAVGLFLISTIPFALRSAARDPAVGAISPMVLAARSCSQLFGILAGILKTKKSHV
ncbi:MAG: glycosyltransferase [Terracidiphilus sp.]